jgi:hypothetical protein
LEISWESDRGRRRLTAGREGIWFLLRVILEMSGTRTSSPLRAKEASDAAGKE